MKKIFYNFFPDIILTLVVAVFFLANYTPGTFLMGWDNVQVDLNPVLGLKRSFYGVWQEYQGLGLLGGMSHSADLIRSVLIYFASKIIPQAVIRYAYHFVMLLMGGIGSYKLINYLLGEKNLAGKITGFLRNPYVPSALSRRNILGHSDGAGSGSGIRPGLPEQAAAHRDLRGWWRRRFCRAPDRASALAQPRAAGDRR